MNDANERNAKPLLTPADVAEQFSVSLPTVYRWVGNGQVPSVRIGRTIRIPSRLLVDRLARSAQP